MAASLAAASAAHAGTYILDVGTMESGGRRVVNISGLGNAYAAPMEFTATHDGKPVSLLAWCVDVYHHITLADYSPNLTYTDTNSLQTDFAPTPHLLDVGDAKKIGLLANYGQDVFDSAPTPVAAFTEIKPTAPAAFTLRAPTAPRAPVAPTPPALNASASVRAAYATKLAAYNTALAAYNVQKAAYDVAKANYDAAKAANDSAKAAYTSALATYNADKAAHDAAVVAYNTAIAQRYTVLSAVQSAIWQVASNLNVTSINHDTAFDLLVDNLSGSHPSNYFNSFSDGGYDYELITPVPVRDSRGRLLAATQSFVFATGAPEPASWALMIGGFGLAGVALRRRRGAAAV